MLRMFLKATSTAAHNSRLRSGAWPLSAIGLVLIVCLGNCAPSHGPGSITLKEAIESPAYGPVDLVPCIRVDLKYTTRDNFMGEDLYGEFRQALMHRDGLARLQAACAFLSMEDPALRLLVWDALRPRSVQRRMWARVVGTDRQKYVADPSKGSVHNTGLAVDLTLATHTGETLDMGTAYDSFEPTAEPARERRLLGEGRLTGRQVANRHTLRRVMWRAGFEQLTTEWWHFDAFPGWYARRNYPLVE